MTRAERHAIQSVEAIQPSVLLVRWGDGHESRFPGLWLLSACACARCGSTETAVRHVRLTELPDNPEIVRAWCDEVGGVGIDWGEEHVSQFDAVWLRGHCLSETERERRTLRPQLWGSEIEDALPYMSYPQVAGDPGQHLAFLERLRDLGFVILQTVPAERKYTEAIAGLVGQLRLTNYGVFELKSKPDPEIVGDTAIALNLHTDEPYRRDPPAITFFHVVEQADDGGDTILADGFKLAEHLRAEDPDAFEILCLVPARFHRTLKEGRAFEMEAPIISMDKSGQVTGLRLLDRGMAPVDVTPETVVPFYQALRKLLALLYSEDGMITVKLQPGEMLIFNNQRLLHGRRAFKTGTRQRHVRSCHVDLDEFHSTLRVAYRKLGREEAWMKFGPGSKT